MKISELLDRYKISRSALYKRLEAVEVKLLKDNRGRSYTSPEQLEILDDLHHYLTNGGRVSDYSPAIAVDVVSEEIRMSTRQSNVQTTIQSNSSIELLEKLVGAIATSIQPVNPIIKKHQDLQQAMENQWLLTSKDVEAITGQKPSRKGGSCCQIGGWRFVVVNLGKAGNKLLWRVEKFGF